MKKIAILGALIFGGASFLSADFSFEQSTQMTGGAMMAMMKVASTFSKKLREPMRGTTIVKGDRMVHMTGETAQIIDLSKETFTDINFPKKTYTVMTFAQWKQMMEDLSKKSKDKSDVSVTYKASVKETGQRKQVSGMDAKQVIVTLEMETTDQKGNKGTMVITADEWLAPKVAGYDEVQSFQKRMAEKLNWTPGGGIFMGRSDMAKAMADVYKESASLDGVPVLMLTKMGMKGDGFAPASGEGQPSGQPAPQPQAQQPAQPAPSVGDAIGGKLGRLGGLGGFGRKKPKDDPQPQAQPQNQPAQQQGSGKPAEPGVLMETTTEYSAFSSAAADPSKFEVPAGFKQVESKIK